MTLSFFLIGAIFGSFVNALVYRLREGLTLGGRSWCPQCKTPISWYDNIPIFSFVSLRGRCRHCREKIPYGYPFVELLTAFVFAGIGYVFFEPGNQTTWLETAYLCLLSIFLIALAVYDFYYMEVPLVLVAAGGILTFFYLSAISLGSSPWWSVPLASGLMGGLLLATFFFLLVYFSHETWMGWGDVWLGFLGGFVVGLPSILFLLTLSSLLGALTGLVGMALGKKKMKSALPFAPFLAIGIILTFFMRETHLLLARFFFL